MIDVTIDVPASDVERMNAVLTQYANHFKGNIPKTVEKTMVKIIVALRAANTTMRSKDSRKIVQKTTKSKYGEASRRLEHIAEYYARKKGIPFVPTRSSKFAIERFTQNGVKYIPLFHRASGRDMNDLADAKGEAIFFYPKSYWIKKPYGKQGLAQSSWAWMLKKLGKTALAEQAEVNSTVSVDTSNRISGGVQAYQITASNRLPYIRHALKANVSSALARASKMMIDEIEGHKKGAAQAAGRAAA